jgi:hypothetical protein
MRAAINDILTSPLKGLLTSVLQAQLSKVSRDLLAAKQKNLSIDIAPSSPPC